MGGQPKRLLFRLKDIHWVRQSHEAGTQHKTAVNLRLPVAAPTLQKSTIGCMMGNFDWTDAFTLLAIVLGPILAVGVGRHLEWKREEHEKKLSILRKLMQTRGRRIDPIHVAALNLIELEFYGKTPVLEALKKYIEHLSSPLPAESEHQRYFEQRADLFLTLLANISKEVGYQFDKKELERSTYVPVAWEDTERLQNENLKLAREFLTGEVVVPIYQVPTESGETGNKS